MFDHIPSRFIKSCSNKSMARAHQQNRSKVFIQTVQFSQAVMKPMLMSLWLQHLTQKNINYKWKTECQKSLTLLAWKYSKMSTQKNHQDCMQMMVLQQWVQHFPNCIQYGLIIQFGDWLQTHKHNQNHSRNELGRGWQWSLSSTVRNT